ncbi:MAG: histone deacetylase [Spirochaetota bacterium]
MELLIFYDEGCLLHDNGPGHPERPERIQSIIRRVEAGEYGPAPRVVAPRQARREEIERVHACDYVDAIEASAGSDRTVFDADTSANAHTFRAAMLAAGGAVAAVRTVCSGEAVRPFVVMRPPGHHAERDRAMGFCIFNNAAVAAADALAGGLERVAIVDYDVHHGNGTEHIFADRRDVLYVSLHEYPHYPGTGRSADTGHDAGAGYTVNVPLPTGSGAAEYLHAFDEIVLPALDRYAPQLVIVSAGFDGHGNDPLAGMQLDGPAYAAMTRGLVEVADRHAEGRIVHLLEGGYDVAGLADGFGAVVGALGFGRDLDDA